MDAMGSPPNQANSAKAQVHSTCLVLGWWYRQRSFVHGHLELFSIAAACL
jgi:hypothetical protein